MREKKNSPLFSLMSFAEDKHPIIYLAVTYVFSPK
jgi:hypothetical protein